MKERLTGAIILVALMVLLVPELLTGPVRSRSAPAASAMTTSSRAAAPGRRAGTQPSLHTYTLTLGSTPSTPSAPDALDTPAARTQPAESSQASPARVPAEEPAAPRTSGLQAAKPAAHRVVPEASPSASTGGWVVQLGSFADRQNAVRLARSLETKGFRMSVSPAKAGSRVLWRVRAGPAHDRTGAQRLAARLRALGHRGELLPTR